jgi:hypothetical protein
MIHFRLTVTACLPLAPRSLHQKSFTELETVALWACLVRSRTRSRCQRYAARKIYCKTTKNLWCAEGWEPNGQMALQVWRAQLAARRVVAGNRARAHAAFVRIIFLRSNHFRPRIDSSILGCSLLSYPLRHASRHLLHVPI